MCLLSKFLFCCLFAYIQKSGPVAKQERSHDRHGTVSPRETVFAVQSSLCAISKMKADKAREARKNDQKRLHPLPLSNPNTLLWRANLHEPSFFITKVCIMSYTAATTRHPLPTRPWERYQELPGCRGRRGCRQHSMAHSGQQLHWIFFQLGNYVLYSSTGGKVKISKPLDHSYLPPQKTEMFLERKKITKQRTVSRGKRVCREQR